LFARGTIEQHTSRKENKLPKIAYISPCQGWSKCGACPSWCKELFSWYLFGEWGG